MAIGVAEVAGAEPQHASGAERTVATRVGAGVGAGCVGCSA